MRLKSSQREKHFRSREKVLGQFFTPQGVADFIVSLASLHLEVRGSGCDPACGGGVFLASMIRNGFKEIFCVDVDERALERASKLIPGDLRGRVKLLNSNALIRTRTLFEKPLLPENYFDLVVGNPPFSSKYGRIRDPAILSSYKMGSGRGSQAIEILFLERFIQLARPGGLVGIILPDGVLININHRKVREYILENTRILAIISLPRGVFEGTLSTSSKTSILVAVKGEKHRGKVFVAEAESLEELPRILEMYKNRSSDGVRSVWAEVSAESLHPKSYLERLELRFRYPAYPLGDLVEEMITGATEYGDKRRFRDNGLRFISARVVTPLGLDFKRDPRFVEPGSSMDKPRARVRVGDVLFVRVGVGCSGRAAVVDEKDLGVADDWIYIIRVKRDKISPFYLAVFLQSRLGRVQIERLKRGVGTVTIPKTLLAKILIPIPPKDLQAWVDENYREMVRLMREGKYFEAREKFQKMICRIEGEVF